MADNNYLGVTKKRSSGEDQDKFLVGNHFKDPDSFDSFSDLELRDNKNTKQSVFDVGEFNEMVKNPMGE